MRIRVGFSAGCAAFALVVSLITALLAGVPFGVSVARAAISAIAFAAVGTLGQVAVSHFLPELEGVLSGRGSKPEDDAPQRTVDIVVDEDDDLVPEMDDESDAPLATDADYRTEGDYSSDDDLEEVSEIDEEIAVEAEEVGVGEKDPELFAASENDDPIGADGVDRLPDLGGLADAFEVSEAVETEAEGRGRSDGQDPALMARALQTMLKRDK